MVTIFMLIDTVAKIEVILNSNPYWYLPPFNEFLFSSEIKRSVFKPDDELKQKGVIRAGYDWKNGWNEIEKILLKH